MDFTNAAKLAIWHPSNFVLDTSKHSIGILTLLHVLNIRVEQSIIILLKRKLSLVIYMWIRCIILKLKANTILIALNLIWVEACVFLLMNEFYIQCFYWDLSKFWTVGLPGFILFSWSSLSRGNQKSIGGICHMVMPLFFAW